MVFISLMVLKVGKILFILSSSIKEEMPDHIFYGFACSLSKYCLNRALSLFANTCFWHDLFYSVGHVCGDNFKSKHVEGLGRGVEHRNL